MPIDTPYNRMVTNEYNQLLRNKVAHEEATYQTVMPSPAGMYVNGYEPVMMGSGVGLYKKECPKGHAVCSCPSGAGISATICGSGRAHGAGEYDRVVGGMNRGLEPAVRVEMALGAGMRGDATSKHGCLDMYQAYAHGGMSFNDRLMQSGMMGHYQQPVNCPRDMSASSIACREGNRPPRRSGPKMPKKTDGTLYHKGVGGRRVANKGQAYNRLLAQEHGNKNKALRQLGNGEGGRRGRPPTGRKGKKGKPGFSFMDAVDTVNAVDSGLNIADRIGLLGEGSAHGRIKKGNKSPLSSGPKKDEKKKDSMYTLDNLVKGIETAEKVGNAVEKVGNLGSKAWSGIKGLFGKGSAHGLAHGGFKPQRGSLSGEKRQMSNNPMVKVFANDYKRHMASKGKGSAHGRAHGGRQTIPAEDRHAEAVRGKVANGRAHGGKSRSEIVKDIMKKMGMAMCEASKYVKQHGLY